ncbi:MAG: hypothetical protein IVW57_00140 [Ktedonobacterales bacterium]|nr:hypothetical protein [Ktedonobacterales bacterium]
MARKAKAPLLRLPFKPEHLDEARQRMGIIAAKQRAVEEAQARLMLARVEWQHEQEALTFWLASQYPRIHPLRGEAWQLDIDHLQLVRQDAHNAVAPTPTPQPEPEPPEQPEG